MVVYNQIHYSGSSREGRKLFIQDNRELYLIEQYYWMHIDHNILVATTHPFRTANLSLARTCINNHLHNKDKYFCQVIITGSTAVLKMLILILYFLCTTHTYEPAYTAGNYLKLISN